MWVVPSDRLACNKCSYEPWGRDNEHFHHNDLCPGKGWKNHVKKTEDMFDQGYDKRPRCPWNGRMMALWICADLFPGNSSFNQMVSETKFAIDWVRNGKDSSDFKGFMCHKKWFTVDGAKKRIPKQLKGLVNVDRFHNTRSPDAKGKTEVYAHRDSLYPEEDKGRGSSHKSTRGQGHEGDERT